MEKPIKLVRASAGAGKTHFLTNRYIDLLLSGDADSYRHILAVTFTNKATDEMKSRVIEALYDISKDTSDPRSREAGKRLTKILHDYSGFSISTIDRFFQTVMRSFAREIGQYASYKVELDLKSVVAQAVDLMVDSLDDPANEALLKWLERYSVLQIESGNSWNITSNLQGMAKLFFREDFRKKVSEVDTIIEDKDAIGRFGLRMSAMINDFRKSVTDAARTVKEAADRAGVDLMQLKGKSRGPFTVFDKWLKGDMKVPSDIAGFEDALAGSGRHELMEAARDAVAIFNKDYVNFRTAEVIRGNLYLLGIYSDLYKNLNKFLKDNNIVLLAQTTDLLNRIIDGNDTPFVYEKIGSRYEHILLDESQDTSVLQWRNFKPLFNESRSQGFENLIVGDIKQSIYRWRGSDWKLISEYAKRDLGEEYVDDSKGLGENWRSASAVVDFNNRIFSAIGSRIEKENDSIGKAVSRIYGDSVQSVPEAHRDLPEGRVKIGFISRDQDDWRADALERMYSDIEELRSHGYAYGDITVLVRKNVEGSVAAEYLISKGIGVITEDSLLVGSSPCVGRMLAVLNYLVNPALPVNRMLVEGFADEQLLSVKGSLYEICESLARNPGIGMSPDQIPFVQAFMDLVISYQDKYGSSLRGFVRWWDEAGHNASICAPDGQDAVRVMTIHKSKGLGLEAVIIPFMAERFVQTGSLIPTVWFSTEGSFSELGLVPLKAVSDLDSTLFSQQYRDEILYQYIDSINTAYVAMTRARSQLIVYAPEPEKPSNYKVSSFASFLFSQLGGSLDGNRCHIEGSFGEFVKERKVMCTLLQDTYVSEEVGDRLSLSLRGADYFDTGVNARLRGIELHDILSEVNRQEDLESACKGDVGSYEYLRERMRFARPEWFDGTYEAINEKAVVDSDGSVYRPDRILTAGDGKAVVVDYKFGREKPRYKEQVRHYCSLLSKMGYPDVAGYLWYVDSGTVVKV